MNELMHVSLIQYIQQIEHNTCSNWPHNLNSPCPSKHESTLDPDERAMPYSQLAGWNELFWWLMPSSPPWLLLLFNSSLASPWLAQHSRSCRVSLSASKVSLTDSSRSCNKPACTTIRAKTCIHHSLSTKLFNKSTTSACCTHIKNMHNAGAS